MTNAAENGGTNGGGAADAQQPKKSNMLAGELADLEAHREFEKSMRLSHSNVFSRACSNLMSRTSYLYEVLGNNPRILLIAFITFAIICGAGVAVILYVAKNQEDEVKEDARTLALETGSWFADQLDLALLPLFSMAQFVSQIELFQDLPEKVGPAYQPGSLPFKISEDADKPSYHRNVTGSICENPELLDRYTEIASTIKSNAKMDGVLVALQVAPVGMVCMVHPLINTEDFPEGVSMDNRGAVGHDLLSDPARVSSMEATIKSDDVVVQGPLTIRQGQASEVSQAFIARLAIKSNDHVIDLNGVSYNAWGFAVALISWNALIERSGVYERFESEGLGFQLTRTDRIFDAKTGLETYEVVDLATTADYHDFSRTVSTVLDTTNNEWTMTVAYTNDDGWVLWAMVGTGLVSLLVTALVLTVMFQKLQYKTMQEKFMDDLSNPQKLRLRLYLEEQKSPTPDADAEDKILNVKPIADLFPHTTVMFADIVGFTAWSSEREPALVLTLLQTIFYAFDQIATKRSVFKVETVGDAYVAVCGIPSPQADHAMRMAAFARECLYKVQEVTKGLEAKLGPDTGDLGMRFGLNSGPVIAGVLVGEKSRFQLFGDTVNFTSRIEASGQKNLVHLSERTANILIEAGKGSWVQPRKDLVDLKGKGSFQTYWLVTSKAKKLRTPRVATDEDTRSIGASSACSSNGEGPLWGDEAFDLEVETNDIDARTDEKQQRLIEWQVDSMARLLKQIVARRGRDRSNSLNKSSHEFHVRKASTRKDGTVLDEVKEVISLPKFDAGTMKKAIDPDSVILDGEVVYQLRDYVSRIASLYRSNPFHNFEHANHVIMAAHKLLNRIVAPEQVNYERKNVNRIASDLHDYTFGITSDPLTHFAVVFSGLIHDADHTGVSNGRLAEEDPDMAKMYRNKSIAEQHSVDVAWNLLMEPEYTALQKCIFATPSELERFRQLVVNSVLATDIFDKELKELRNLRWDKAFHPEKFTSDHSESVSFSGSGSSDDMTKHHVTNRKATIVIEHIIQASDVAHTMQHWHVYKKWNERLFQEMHVAWKMGRSMSDPSKGWYKGELWFFDNYVIPLAKKLEECGVFGVASDECLHNALENRKEWAKKGEQVVAEMVATCSKLKLGAKPSTVTEETEEDEEE